MITIYEKGSFYMKKLFIALTLSVAVFALAACNKSADAPANKADTLAVYTTVYPLSFFSERIGGEHVTVNSIYPPGANEHTFEPTQKDMMKLADADVFFYIGLGLEGFVEKAQGTLEKENVKLVATASDVSDAELAVSTGHVHAEDEDADEHNHEHGEHEHEHGDHDHGDIDPHVWLSPTISKDLALSIKDTLVEAMPEHKEEFEKNYEALTSELQQLDDDFTAMAAQVTHKTFFVSHAAFGYIAGNYGLTQVPIAGLNSQSEPSQKALAKIVAKAKDEHITTIFFEQNVSSKLAKVIQNEVGAKAATLHNLSVLTKDDIANNEDYFTLMHKNIDALKEALK